VSESCRLLHILLMYCALYYSGHSDACLVRAQYINNTTISLYCSRDSDACLSPDIEQSSRPYARDIQMCREQRITHMIQRCRLQCANRHCGNRVDPVYDAWEQVVSFEGKFTEVKSE